MWSRVALLHDGDRCDQVTFELWGLIEEQRMVEVVMVTAWQHVHQPSTSYSQKP